MNYICICGIIPFLFTFIYNLIFYNISFVVFIPLFIFINGFLFHGIYPKSLIIMYNDIICNIVFSLYMNYYTLNQPYCIINTIFMFLIFCFNQKYLNKSNIIHFLCIQLFALQLYYDAQLLK